MQPVVWWWSIGRLASASTNWLSLCRSNWWPSTLITWWNFQGGRESCTALLVNGWLWTAPGERAYELTFPWASEWRSWSDCRYFKGQQCGLIQVDGNIPRSNAFCPEFSKCLAFLYFKTDHIALRLVVDIIPPPSLTHQSNIFQLQVTENNSNYFKQQQKKIGFIGLVTKMFCWIWRSNNASDPISLHFSFFPRLVLLFRLAKTH